MIEMKGKSIFTKAEADQIISLIEQKLKADSGKQKGIRQKIRNLGFYAKDDFKITGGYTVNDFKRVVTIIGSAALKSKTSTEKKSVVKTMASVQPAKPESKSQKEFSIVFSKDIIGDLKKVGFRGFVTIKDIINNYHVLPKEKGVYILLHTEKSPKFLKVGTGGLFKGKEPNVSLDILKQNWVKDSPIIYIGKAGSETGSATLQSRLKQYFNFGQGKAVGHWGGRYIWQLDKPYNTIVCWIETPNDDPRIVEAGMIKDFVEKYGGRPFANLVG